MSQLSFTVAAIEYVALFAGLLSRPTLNIRCNKALAPSPDLGAGKYGAACHSSNRVPRLARYLVRLIRIRASSGEFLLDFKHSLLESRKLGDRHLVGQDGPPCLELNRLGFGALCELVDPGQSCTQLGAAVRLRPDDRIDTGHAAPRRERRTIIRNFVEGCCDRIGDRLLATMKKSVAVQTDNSKALVVIQKQAIAEKLKECDIKLRTCGGGSRGNFNEGAYGAGRSAGALMA